MMEENKYHCSPSSSSRDGQMDALEVRSDGSNTPSSLRSALQLAHPFCFYCLAYYVVLLSFFYIHIHTLGSDPLSLARGRSDPRYVFLPMKYLIVKTFACSSKNHTGVHV